MIFCAMVSPTVNAPFFLIYNILILYQEGLLVNLVTLSQKGAKAWRGWAQALFTVVKGLFHHILFPGGKAKGKGL